MQLLTKLFELWLIPTKDNLLPTVRSDCKNLGAAPITCNGLEPVRSDSREQIYLKIIWCEWSIREQINLGSSLIVNFAFFNSLKIFS